MMRRLALGVALFGALVSAACGGKVYVDASTGSGGSGGSGSITATGNTATTGSGAGGTNIQTACEKLCSVGDAYGCDTGGPSCAPSCASAIDSTPAECQGLYVAALECITASIPSVGCELENVCLAELQELNVCLSSTTCGAAECYDTGTGCGCKGECQGQVRSTECSASGTGYACDCFLNGELVGSCSESSSGSVCDIQYGCCGLLFG
ncbi:MAG: hypothetical protein IPK82_17765 [Polyangiaceae bacterium]|nr:hypothetical protein [Polyangiaceae bacterium]